MVWMIRNSTDGRIVLKHKEFDRFYVSDPISIDLEDNLQPYRTEDIKEAYEVLEATKYHWCGDWKVVEGWG